MRLRAIRFGPDELPAEIEITISVDEAAALTRLIGQLSPKAADEAIGPALGGHLFAVSRVLGEQVFNAYWEDGADDYARGEGGR